MKEKNLSEKPYVYIDPLECKGCGRCIKACPANVIQFSGKLNERGYQYAVYTGKGCTGCGNCYYICPETSAVEVHRPLK